MNTDELRAAVVDAECAAAKDIPERGNRIARALLHLDKRVKELEGKTGFCAACEQAQRDNAELAAAQRREKRLRRQVELMGDLLDSLDIPADGVEDYPDADLEILGEWWPAAADELHRRQMAADNPDHRDDAARQAWKESR